MFCYVIFLLKKDLLTTFQVLGVKHDGVPLGAATGTEPVWAGGDLGRPRMALGILAPFFHSGLDKRQDSGCWEECTE